MPLTEVAASLGIPVGTAKSRLHYGLAAMRDAASREPECGLGPGPGRAAGMTTSDRFERDVPGLLELYLGPMPPYRDDILSRTAVTRQRPGWTFIERWLPVSAITGRLTAGSPVPWRALALAALLLMAPSSLPRSTSVASNTACRRRSGRPTTARSRSSETATCISATR